MSATRRNRQREPIILSAMPLYKFSLSNGYRLDGVETTRFCPTTRRRGLRPSRSSMTCKRTTSPSGRGGGSKWTESAKSGKSRSSGRNESAYPQNRPPQLAASWSRLSSSCWRAGAGLRAAHGLHQLRDRRRRRAATLDRAGRAYLSEHAKWELVVLATKPTKFRIAL